MGNYGKFLDKNKLVRLYNKEKICVPPKSSMYIPIEAKQKEILSDDHDVIIFGDEHFHTKKQLLQNPVCIGRKENLLISVINMYDTSVTINKGEIIAAAISCDNKTQGYLDKTLCERIKKVNKKKVEQMIGSIGQQDNINNWNTADRKHFGATINEKRE